MPDVVWGGRFAKGPHPEMLRLTDSSKTDIRLLPYDVAATRAHGRGLVKAGLLTEDEFLLIDDALKELLQLHEAGAGLPEAEDVHSLVEAFLTQKLGETGARIHAGRSRNDLVATDFRLYCKDAASAGAAAVSSLVRTICTIARQHSGTVMPGYTHLQRAQPVTLGFHLLAHGFALERDLQRFLNARSTADVSSLGAGAVAGTTLPLDAGVLASELDLAGTFDNAMDAVSSRDFAIDLAYACASTAITLSRLAEEVVLWTSSEFAFASLSDEWSTGSSMMPQKRNPDLAELIRGRSALALADLNALLILLKGLPLAYDRDLQEDKALVFATVDRTLDATNGMGHLLASLTFNEDRMAAAAASSATWATDVAEALVEAGLPFRRAHEIAGRLVAELEASARRLEDLTSDELAAIDPALSGLRPDIADPTGAVARRLHPGGTAPARVVEQADELGARVDRSAI